MRTSPRHLAAIVIATTAMSVVAPMTTAGADPGDTVQGGCFFNTDENQTVTGGANVGVIGDASVTRHASGLPSNATVSCWIEVNGVEASGTRITESGTGVQTGVQQIAFAATPEDAIAECQQVTFEDGSTWAGGPFGTNPDCSGLNAQGGLLDPTVCPVFITVGQVTDGRIFGVIAIGADGDLSVADPIGPGYTKVYDCPPYDHPPL